MARKGGHGKEAHSLFMRRRGHSGVYQISFYEKERGSKVTGTSNKKGNSFLNFRGKLWREKGRNTTCRKLMGRERKGRRNFFNQGRFRRKGITLL